MEPVLGGIFTPTRNYTPSTSVSYISVSIAPDEKCVHENLSKLTEIYNNIVFSHSFDKLKINSNFENSTVLESNTYAQTTIGSASSFYTNNNNFNNNTISTSPSLKSAYSIKRASSFRKSFNRSNSFLTDEKDSRYHSFTSRSSSLTLLGSLDHNKDDHPLFIKFPEMEIDSPSQNNPNAKNELYVAPLMNEIRDNECTKFSESNRSDYSNTAELHSSVKSKKKSFLTFLKKINNTINNPLNFSNGILYKNIRNTNKNYDDVPLETYSQEFEYFPNYYENVSIENSNFDSIMPIYLEGKTKRIREYRVNSDYLRQYATGTNSKLFGILNSVSDDEIDIFDDLLLESYPELTDIPLTDFSIHDKIFDELFLWELKFRFQTSCIYTEINSEYLQLLKISSLSRFKLWSAVTLPPRLDPVPSLSSIINDIYPYASLDNYRVPWLHIKDLKSGKAVNKFTKSAGLLKGGSNIQYVSKKCLSKRWVCSNSKY